MPPAPSAPVTSYAPMRAPIVRDMKSAAILAHRARPGAHRPTSTFASVGPRVRLRVVDPMTDSRPSDSVSTDASEASLLGELFDNSPVPLVVTSLVRDRILAVNRRSEEVFGLRGEDVVGGSVIAFYSDPQDRQTILNAIRETGRLTN